MGGLLPAALDLSKTAVPDTAESAGQDNDDGPPEEVSNARRPNKGGDFVASDDDDGPPEELANSSNAGHKQKRGQADFFWEEEENQTLLATIREQDQKKSESDVA